VVNGILKTKAYVPVSSPIETRKHHELDVFVSADLGHDILANAPKEAL
jgi:hypothetical protein